ncbi:MAG: ribose 5-phosphate isomerase B [Planctomycetota bacterium]|jgi:ribose 5-phosphate isomerase B|nr:ribose 5-phosphate isomerase B [Planctomycetota bacterium]
MPNPPIWIASDHGGYVLKKQVLAFLDEQGVSYRDVGTHSEEIVRYPYYAAEVAGAVSSGKAERGILICSTGIGMSIVANRFPGVRASLCTSTYMGKMTRAHNDSNILCLGGMLTAKLEALDILEAWLSTEYLGGRHDISLNLIGQLDEHLHPAGTAATPAAWTEEMKETE